MVRALFAKSPSPVPILKASDPHTAYFMHWLFALLDRVSIVGISGWLSSRPSCQASLSGALSCFFWDTYLLVSWRMFGASMPKTEICTLLPGLMPASDCPVL